MNYLEDFNKNSIDSLKKKISKTKIILFGASTLGKEVLNLLKSNNINIDFWCDNNKEKWGEEIEGIFVLPLEKLKSISKKTNIIITSMYYDEISMQLIKLGFTNILYCCKRNALDETEKKYNLFDFININDLRNEINKTKILKDCKKDERAFVLATGPSINLENLKVLNREDSYSISNFFLHKDIGKIKPNMHFFAPYHIPLILTNYIEWLKMADKELPVDTNICLEFSTKRLIDDFKIFANRTIYYVKYNTFTTKINIDLEKGILPPQTGPTMILPLLMYMGYSQIYLLGCDCNMLKDYGKTTNNFYNKEKDCRKNSTNGKVWIGIVEELKSQLNMFLQYELYKNVADKNNIIIKNLSKDSWLDIFERDSLSNIIMNTN